MNGGLLSCSAPFDPIINQLITWCRIGMLWHSINFIPRNTNVSYFRFYVQRPVIVYHILYVIYCNIFSLIYVFTVYWSVCPLHSLQYVCLALVLAPTNVYNVYFRCCSIPLLLQMYIFVMVFVCYFDSFSNRPFIEKALCCATCVLEEDVSSVETHVIDK